MENITLFCRKKAAGFFLTSAVLTMTGIVLPVTAEKITAETTTLRDVNGRLALTFGSSENGFPLDMVFDVKERRAMTRPGLPLWSVELQHSSGKKLDLTSAQCGHADIDILTSSLVTMTWSLDRALEGAAPAGKDEPVQQLRAVCSVQLDCARALLKLRLYNHTTTWSIRSVTFPTLELTQLGKTDDDDAFVYPFASGRVVKSPLRKDFIFGDEQNMDTPGRYSSSWANMQFCAYWDNDGGLYIAAEDPLSSRKTISVQPTDDHASISAKILWPAEDIGIAGNDFEHPGSIALELFNGDWYDAAKLYRQWVMREAHWWPALGAEGRIDTPSWMKETAVWVVTSFSPETIEQTIRFSEFMGVPTAVHLYGWWDESVVNGYPYYFPVKNGFRVAVKKLQESGVRVMPYINARLWDHANKDFLSIALPAATKKENGDYHSEFTEVLVPMCPTTVLWQNMVKTTVIRIVGPELDADGVYLDQTAAMCPVLCYDPSHGHPLGGGHWWMTDGHWPMLEGIRKIMTKEYPDKILTAECNAEPYIHCFDGYLTWHYEWANMVPLFSAVYGGAIQQFGRTYSGNDQVAHRMRIGQSLVFGEQIGWIDPGIIDQKETVEFLRDAARIRHKLSPFLSWGEMMRPPELFGHIPEISGEWDWIWGAEKIITESAVQRGAWKSPDGKIVFIFANVSDGKVSFTWRINPSRYGFGKGNLTVEPVSGAAGNLTIKAAKNIPVTLSGREITAFIVSLESKGQ